MKKIDTGLDKETNCPAPRSIKKPYKKSPSLVHFGALGRLTQGSGGNGKDANNTMTKQSDRRLKHNFVRVGGLQSGLNLYLFDYLSEFRGAGQSGRQLGVMADEVEQVMPEAVYAREDGYKMVDYGRLDIKPVHVAAAFRN